MFNVAAPPKLELWLHVFSSNSATLDYETSVTNYKWISLVSFDWNVRDVHHIPRCCCAVIHAPHSHSSHPFTTIACPGPFNRITTELVAPENESDTYHSSDQYLSLIHEMYSHMKTQNGRSPHQLPLVVGGSHGSPIFFRHSNRAKRRSETTC